MTDYHGIETAETVRVVGRVKWFDPTKGYGFIVPDDPTLTDLRDVLLHISSLRDKGRDHAEEGAPIVCDCVRRAKGWQAVQVHELGVGDVGAVERRRCRCFEYLTHFARRCRPRRLSWKRTSHQHHRQQLMLHLMLYLYNHPLSP